VGVGGLLGRDQDPATRNIRRKYIYPCQNSIIIFRRMLLRLMTGLAPLQARFANLRFASAYSVPRVPSFGLPWIGLSGFSQRIPQLNALSFPMLQNLTITRCMNRNARRPKKANHGKRPVSHARRRQKMKTLKSRAYREKIFGFW